MFNNINQVALYADLKCNELGIINVLGTLHVNH